MAILTQKELQSIAHAAMNQHKPTIEMAKDLLLMAKAQHAADDDNESLLEIIEAAEFDMDVSGQLNEGLALQLAEALLDEEDSHAK